jgi:hypothetical protein
LVEADPPPTVKRGAGLHLAGLNVCESMGQRIRLIAVGLVFALFKECPMCSLCGLTNTSERVERLGAFDRDVCAHVGNHRVLQVADVLWSLEQLDLHV